MSKLKMQEYKNGGAQPTAPWIGEYLRPKRSLVRTLRFHAPSISPHVPVIARVLFSQVYLTFNILYNFTLPRSSKHLLRK